MATTLQSPVKNYHSIFDVLYGFIPITEWEEKIINSPFFQRLRWIKQLGFANYIFPGAEHNRFAHVIGVMHSMDQMIRALNLAVPDAELFDPQAKSDAALLHKSLRIAALLHDIGTFPFSHSIENAYIRHGKKIKNGSHNSFHSHEHLGSFIIKNTDYKNGITQILNEYGFDVHLIAQIIKGESPSFIANQLMHSDLDADRMDYLIRDSHYTGIKYGQFDRDYILANLTTYQTESSKNAFGIRENAIHTVADFLFARFSWYSQIIKNPGSAKFDIMASSLAESFLENKLIYSFHDLLSMIKEGNERFFWWNDIYFMTLCQEVHFQKIIQNAKTSQLVEMLLYRNPPKTVHHPLFSHRILAVEGKTQTKANLVKEIKSYIHELEQVLEKHGTEKDWLLVDIPERDVLFTQDPQPKSDLKLFQGRDAIRVISKKGHVSLLVDKDNTLMKHLSNFFHFAPSIYASPSAIHLLRGKNLIETE